MTISPELEKLSAEIHSIYMLEAKRQGDVRHQDNYEDLPENIKEFDRVLARRMLEREALARAEERERIAMGVRTIADDWEMNDPRAVRGMEKEILALLTQTSNTDL